jgi:hypothetical protein
MGSRDKSPLWALKRRILYRVKSCPLLQQLRVTGALCVLRYALRGKSLGRSRFTFDNCHLAVGFGGFLVPNQRQNIVIDSITELQGT